MLLLQAQPVLLLHALQPLQHDLRPLRPQAGRLLWWDHSLIFTLLCRSTLQSALTASA